MPAFRQDFPRLQSLLLVLFFVCVGMIWVKSLGIITTEADTGYPESALVETARLAAQSGRLYPGLDTAPYTPAPYGPLFYMGLAAAGRICDGNAAQIRLLARSVVFASYALLGLMGFLLARSAGASRIAAALGAAAIWTAPQVWMFWNVSVRPDFPALLFGLTGVWIVSRRDSPTYTSVILSGVCCACALLIKQSYVAAPLAIALSFVLRRSYRKFSVFSATVSLVGLSVIGYLMLRGEPVIREILTTSAIPRSFHGAVSLLYGILSVGLGVLVIGGGFAGVLHALRPASNRQGQILSLYLVFSLFFTTVALLNIGRNGYYLFEIWTVASLLLATVVSQAEAVWQGLSRELRAGAAVALLLLAAQSLLAIRHPVQLVNEYKFDRLQNLHILAEDPSLTVRGTNPELLDPWLATCLERQHTWNPSGFLDEIRREEFDVVFTDRVRTLLSASMHQSLAESYRPLCHTSNMQVLIPRNRASRFSASDASYTLGEACD